MDTVTNAPDYVALLAEAEARLVQEGVPEEWGHLVELAEGENFQGRYRGETVDQAFDRVVYLLVDLENQPCFIRHRTTLQSEIEREKPQPGDPLVIVRGEDQVGKSGNTYHRYAVRSRPSSEPLPQPAATSQNDGDFPF
jgi:hypothetical protein